jgi:hypothetical protein
MTDTSFRGVAGIDDPGMIRSASSALEQWPWKENDAIPRRDRRVGSCGSNNIG